MKLNKIKINSILEYIIVFLTILELTSVYSNSNLLPIGILTLLTIFLSLYAVLNMKNIVSISKKKVGIYFIYLIYISIFMITSVSNNNYFNFMVKYILIFSIFYFNIKTKEDLKKYLICYSNIILGLCCLSLIMYFLGYFCGVLPVNYDIILNWGNPKIIGSIFNLHFFIQKETFLGLTLIRNTGVFCEAPMYMLNLVLCLAIDLFYLKKSKKTILILILGILSTLSSTGYIMLVILMFLSFISSKKVNFKIIIMPLILIIAISMVSNVLKAKSSTRSYSVRYDDYIASIKSWKKDLMFGNGYKNNEEFLDNISSFRETNKGQSSSIGAVLSQGGIYLMILYIVTFVTIYKYNAKSKYFATIYFILFLLTVFQYTAIELFIISSSINLINIKKQK